MLPRQIEAFVAVARLGQMGPAAESLFIGQPALSGRIAALEQDLGAQLFVRSHAGMKLTPAGRAFLPYAERAIEGLRAGAALVGEMERGLAGEVTIGAVPTVSAYVLPELLVRFTQAHPNVRLFVRTGHSEEILEAVVRGEVAVGIIRELRDSRVRSRPLYADELHLVARSDHPFAKIGRVDIVRMTETRLILFDRRSTYYDLTQMVLRQAGVTPHDVVEVDNIEAAKRMVEHGLGVAFLPATAMVDSVTAGRIARVRLDGVELTSRRIALVEPITTTRHMSTTTAFIASLAEIPRLIPGARAITPEER